MNLFHIGVTPLLIGEKTMFDKLMDAIINMREEDALTLANDLLDNHEQPLAVLDTCTKAMETVGKRFEAGDYFLPELMMGGEILKQISDIVKPKIADGSAVGVRKKGKVLIGTVQGDIHDIGKNIVTFLLDVNGFEVRDMGIDVPPSRFVAEIKTFEPQVVGLSGLLTLAYDAMKDTVQAIVDGGVRDRVKIMIGGGLMSENVSTYAGADAFAKDAMEGVVLTKKWIMGM